MAMVTATRIQDDFSSNRPHLLCVGKGPQVVLGGLRTDGPIFRADFSAAVPTHAKEAQTVYNLDFIPTCALLHMRIKTRSRFEVGLSC
jgi:hypothetical protein